MVRDRGDARWLPSRFRYASFRLLAWAMFRSSGPEPRRGIVMGVDRDQSTLESYSIAGWLTITSSCLAYAVMGRFLPPAAAALVSPLAAVVFLQGITVAVTIAGALVFDRGSGTLVSFATWFLVTVAAILVADYQTWPRYVAWSFLIVLAVNAVAAGIARIFRNRLLEPERQVGAV